MKKRKKDYKQFIIGVLTITILIPNFFCVNKTPYNHGRILYENFCANCHMEDGTGLAGVIPPLAGSDYLETEREKLPCLIRNGIKGEMVVNGKVYSTEMPGVPQLTEFEITNVINFINTSWGNNFEVVKHLNVRKALNNCK